jgi:hypothetical protein
MVRAQLLHPASRAAWLHSRRMQSASSQRIRDPAHPEGHPTDGAIPGRPIPRARTECQQEPSRGLEIKRANPRSQRHPDMQTDPRDTPNSLDGAPGSLKRFPRRGQLRLGLPAVTLHTTRHARSIDTCISVPQGPHKLPTNERFLRAPESTLRPRKTPWIQEKPPFLAHCRAVCAEFDFVPRWPGLREPRRGSYSEYGATRATPATTSASTSSCHVRCVPAFSDASRGSISTRRASGCGWRRAASVVTVRPRDRRCLRVVFDEHLNRQHRLAYFARGPEWAFVIPQGDMEALEDVMRRCSQFWNGVGSLLIPATADGRIPSWVEKLLRVRPVEVCFLHERLSAGASAGVQRRIPGAVPLRDAFADREVRPLDLPPPAWPGRAPEVMVELPRFHSQALRRATVAIWGHIPSESSSEWEANYELHEREGEEAHGALLRGQIEGQSVSPLRLSARQMGGIWQESPLDRAYVFVVSSASFNTLVTFWNLRARSLAPANGLPVIGILRESLRWPEQLGALNAWLGPRTLWRGSNEFFVACRQGLDDEVRGALARLGFAETRGDSGPAGDEAPSHAPTFRFASPWLGGPFIRGAYASALVAFADGRSSLALPAPEGFKVRGLRYTRLVLHNLPLPLPLTPRAARRVDDRNAQACDGVMRLTNAAPEWNYDIHLPTAAEALEDWIADQGFSVVRTQDGRDAEALLRRLGSLAALDVLADHQRVALLKVLAPQSRKKLAQRLVAEAKRAGARVDEAVMLERLSDLGLFLEVQARSANEIASELKGQATKEDVLGLLGPLVEAGFVRRARSVRCPGCRFRMMLALDEHRERIACRACGETFTMPVTDNSGRAEAACYYRLDGLMARAMDQDVLPVLLTLRAVRPPAEQPTLFFAWPGVEVTAGAGKPVDIDLLVSDGHNVWCFEVKQNATGLNQAQFRKLLDVATKLKARPCIAAVDGAFPPDFSDRVQQAGGRVLTGNELLG